MARSLFRPATELMVQYARYHRDRRNILTHMVGVPMIVFGLGVMLARATVLVAGQVLSLGWVVWALSSLWYLTRGQWLLGLAVSAVNAVLMALAHQAAAGGNSWWAWALGFFGVGWVVQFVGHYYEGKKPAFVDDLVGLLVGPMFVTAEALFSLGLQRGLLQEVERRAGPTMLRDLAHPAV